MGTDFSVEPVATGQGVIGLNQKVDSDYIRKTFLQWK